MARCGRGAGRRREDGRGVAQWKSGLLEWCGILANPHQRSGQPTKEARLVQSVPRLVSSLRVSCRASDQRLYLLDRAARRRTCRSVQIRSSQFGLRWSPSGRGRPSAGEEQSLHSVGGLGTRIVATFWWKVRTTKRRASRRCLTRARQGVPKPWWKEQRWNHTIRSAQLSVRIVNRGR